MTACSGAGARRASQLVLCLLCLLAFQRQAPGQVVSDAAPTVRVGFARGGGGSRSGGGYAVESLPLETYVSRVLAGEAAAGSPPAALQALAMVIRTYALSNLDRHGGAGFDLCDETHCQVVRDATSESIRATDATAGRVLLADGVPAGVFYSASCGGHTEVPSAVWPGSDDPAHLPARPDDACAGGPRWQTRISARVLMRALEAAGYRGTLLNMRVVARSTSGRVAALELEGMTPSSMSGQALRSALGTQGTWNLVKSAAFEVERAGREYQFVGHGSGHGVGMCVLGSALLAERGQTVAEILARYFPGLSIGGPESPEATLAETGSRVGSAPVGTAERQDLDRLVEQAQRQLSSALGLTVQPSLNVRVHPTIAEYERATGQPWFTSGFVVDDVLHTVPFDVLRGRGLLERTIRRGVVHLLTWPTLADRPVWVREGLASVFADRIDGSPASESRPPRTECPKDRELLRPVSVGTLADARARARACFERQIGRGRPWSDVR